MLERNLKIGNGQVVEKDEKTKQGDEQSGSREWFEELTDVHRLLIECGSSPQGMLP